MSSINFKNIFFVSFIIAMTGVWAQDPHADIFKEKFGMTTDDNNVLEWTDGYQSSSDICKMEPKSLSFSDTRKFHNIHIPRDCHLQIADYLKSTSTSFDQMEHALYHQVMSGRGIRYNMLFPIHRRGWTSHLKSDPQYTSLKKIRDEVSRQETVVYGGDTTVDYDVTLLEKSYDWVHGNQWVGDLVLGPAFIFFFFYWVIIGRAQIKL